MKSLGQIILDGAELGKRLLEGLLAKKPALLPRAKMPDLRVDPRPEYGGPIKTQVWGPGL